MAGDWIKMRTNLDSDPRVIEMATTLEVNELHVVGMLWKVWSWADTHSIDGNAIRVTHVTLDRFTGCNGFADALRKVGWLDGRDNAITFPRFAEHNGQTAKKRAETKERVAKHRNAKPVTDVTQKALPEKRREEKSITHTHTQSGRIRKAEDLLADGFQAEWQQWCDYKLALDGKHLDAITGQIEIQRLTGLGVEKAKRDIQFSIRKQAKSLLDSSNDYEAQAAERRQNASQPKRGSGVMSVDELLRGVKQEAKP